MEYDKIIEILRDNIHCVKQLDDKERCSECKFINRADELLDAYEGAIDCVNKLAEVTATLQNMMDKYGCMKCEESTYVNCYTCLKAPKYRACLEMMMVLEDTNKKGGSDDSSDNNN